MKTRFLITLFAAFLIAGTGNIVKAQETKMETKYSINYSRKAKNCRNSSRNILSVRRTWQD